MANRWWMLVALAAVVMTLAALLLLRSAQQPQAVRAPPPPPPPPAVVDAGPACPDATLAPRPPLPLLDEATVLLIGDGQVRFQVDGQAIFSTGADPKRLSAGPHVVSATAQGATEASLTLEVEPFHPALVLGFVAAGAVVLAPFEAACPACGTSQTALDFRFTGQSGQGGIEAAARALSHGEWRKATEALRALPDEVRREPFPQLQAAALAQAGEATAAATVLDTSPGSHRARWAQARKDLDALAPKDAALEPQAALLRWNLLTDRFTRLTNAFGTDAPGPVGTTNQRFNDLSRGFTRAQKEEDAIEAAATVKAAHEALVAMVRELRGMKPRDCSWQARVTGAM